MTRPLIYKVIAIIVLMLIWQLADFPFDKRIKSKRESESKTIVESTVIEPTNNFSFDFKSASQLVSIKPIKSLAELKTSAGFFQNNGQYQQKIKYALRRNAVDVLLFENSFGYLTKERVTSDSGEKILSHFIEIKLKGANPHPTIIKSKESRDSHHFFKKAGVKPPINTHHYRQVIYQDIYPNIDMAFLSYPTDENNPGFKYNFVVHPGGNPSDIVLIYQGQKSLSISELGPTGSSEGLINSFENRQLNLHTSPDQVLQEQISEIFTFGQSEKIEISGRYVIDGNEVRIEVDAYEATKDLIIDPDLVLLTTRASTYYGTEGTDRMRDVATDSNGDIFVVGQTAGDSIIISTPGTFQADVSDMEGDNDIIIAKFSADLTELLVASYYGGGGTEDGFGIALDASNNVYISGYTSSPDLPTASGIYSAQGEDLLVARFNPTLTTLDWTSPGGGAESDRANDIALVGNSVFIVGTTFSSGLQSLGSNLSGTSDAFISGLNAANGSQLWFRYYGDTDEDQGNAIVGGNNRLYVTGNTFDPLIFNTRAFVGELDADGQLLNSENYGVNIVSKAVNISEDESFLVIAGGIDGGGLTNTNHQTSRGGNRDGFLIKVFTSDLSVEWSSYYGGTERDELQGVAIDCNDFINVIGYTRSSNDGNVIAVNGIINSFKGGGGNPEDRGDALLVKFSSDGQRQWGSYFGDTGDEEAIGITLGADGNVIICGATLSRSGITTSGTFDPNYGERGIVGFVTTFCDVIVDEEPQDITVPVGGDAFFEVDGMSCGSITGYQWYKGESPAGVLLSDGAGGTGSTLSGTSTVRLDITSVTFSDEGRYCVLINTICGEAIELCANLDLVDLVANNVCLDFGSILGSPSTNQDSIKLSFVDLETTPNITNVTYLWSLTNASANPNGGNTVVAGSNSAGFPFTLPMAAPIDDLYEITVLPSAAGTYTYQLVFEYDDDRRPSARVKDSISVTAEVFPFPAVTNLIADNITVCEDEALTLTVTTDISLDSLVYERIDANAANLTGHESGKIEGDPIGANPAQMILDEFSNQSNLPLTASFRITPFSENGCEGISDEITVTIKPNPEFSVTNHADSICNGAAVNIAFAAETSPIDYTANGGISFSFERLTNTAISEAPVSMSGISNSGTITEALTNTSAVPQVVTYRITADYNSCDITRNVSVIVLPDASLVFTADGRQTSCSGDEVSFSLGGSISDMPTTITVVFEDNPLITGDNDFTLTALPNSNVDFNATFVNTSTDPQTVKATITPGVTIEGGITCSGSSEDFFFEISPNPIVDNDSLSICDGETLAIDLAALTSATSGVSFSWTASNTGGSVSGFSGGMGTKITDELTLNSGEMGEITYLVTADVNGCISDPAVVKVTVLGLAGVSLTSVPLQEVCGSDPVPVTITADITGGAGSTIRWFLENTLVPGEVTTELEVLLPGNYRIEVESSSGCISRGDIVISQVTRTNVTIDAMGSENTCLDDDFILRTSLSGGGVASSYQWIKEGFAIAGATLDSLVIPDAGNYQVVINQNEACSDTSQVVNVSFFPNPLPAFELPASACPLAEIPLIAVNNNSAAIINNISWSVAGPNPLPTFSDASAANTLLSFGENQVSDRVYQVTLTMESDNGCRVDSTLSITHQPRPSIDFSFPANNCSGVINPVSLSSAGADTHLWEIVSGDGNLSIDDPSDLNTTFLATHTTNVPQSYEVRLTATVSSSGCENTLTKTLIIYPQPTMSIAGNLSPICNGSEISLSANTSESNTADPFTSLEWFVNAQLAETGESLIRNLTNTGVVDSIYDLLLIGTNSRGCTDSSSVSITVHPDARAQIVSTQQQACVPFLIDGNIISATEFDGANNDDFRWEVDSAGIIIGSATGLTPPVYIINQPDISISYRLTAFSKSGCQEDVDSFTFNSFPATIADFSLSQSEVCEDDEIVLANNSTNAVISRWNFGDGRRDSTENPPTISFGNTSFTRDTTYTIMLETATANGCLDSTGMTILVHPKPLASFSATGACAGELVTVTNNSIGKGNLQYLWTADPSTGISISDSVAFEPTFTFDDNQGADNVFNVSLSVTSADDCVENTTVPIVITARPEAGFQVSSISCTDVPTTFRNQSVNSSSLAPDSVFIWEFGDGTIDTTARNENIDHIYADTGTYVVKLTAVNTAGCIDLFSDSLRVIGTPVPVITSTQNPESGCAPVGVVFSSDSSLIFDEGETYFWDFGNGDTSVLSNPLPVTYFQNDDRDTTYFVTLTITNLCGSVTAMDSFLVKPNPIADFSIVPFNTGCDDLPVTILNESRGLPQFFVWDYGDGAVDTVTSREPREHIYQNDSDRDTTYMITLTAVNDCSIDTTTREVTIIPFNDNATIQIENNDNLFCLGEEMTAIVAGLGGRDGRIINWTFDGVPLAFNDTVRIPLNEVGIFDLILSVEVRACRSTIRDTLKIEVQEGPDIDFRILNSPICTGESTEIENLGLVKNPGTLWYFGDGSDTLSAINPAPHPYNEPGTYTISMILTGANGCPTIRTKEVVVEQTPKAEFSNQGVFCEDLTYSFESTSINAESFKWKIVETQDSSFNDVFVRSFQEPGTYTIELTAYAEVGQSGCFDVLRQPIEVNANPVAAFELSDFLVCKDSLVTIFNQSSGAGRYLWTLWDENEATLIEEIGETADLAFFNYSISTAQNYIVKLEAFSPAGCVSTASRMLEVVDIQPEIDFIRNPFCRGEAIQLLNTGSYEDAGVIDFRWEVNDSLISEQFMPLPYEVMKDTTRRNKFIDVTLSARQGSCEQMVVEEIEIKPFLGCEFRVPDAFILSNSVNPLGENETWKIHINPFDTSEYTRIQLKVYNENSRQLVYVLDFERTGGIGTPMLQIEGGAEFNLNRPNWFQNLFWDGRSFDEKPVPIGRYYYELQISCCDNSSSTTQTGFIQITGS